MFDLEPNYNQSQVSLDVLSPLPCIVVLIFAESEFVRGRYWASSIHIIQGERNHIRIRLNISKCPTSDGFMLWLKQLPKAKHVRAAELVMSGPEFEPHSCANSIRRSNEIKNIKEYFVHMFEHSEQWHGLTKYDFLLLLIVLIHTQRITRNSCETYLFIFDFDSFVFFFFCREDCFIYQCVSRTHASNIENASNWRMFDVCVWANKQEQQKNDKIFERSLSGSHSRYSTEEDSDNVIWAIQ